MVKTGWSDELVVCNKNLKKYILKMILKLIKLLLYSILLYTIPFESDTKEINIKSTYFS